MDSRITPQEKSKPISEAKDDYFNEVIRLRSDYIKKRLENTYTPFDFTAFFGALMGLVQHTNYYLPESKMYGKKPLRKAILEYICDFKKIDKTYIEDGLNISEAYIIALQEESICSYK